MGEQSGNDDTDNGDPTLCWEEAQLSIEDQFENDDWDAGVLLDPGMPVNTSQCTADLSSLPHVSIPGCELNISTLDLRTDIPPPPPPPPTLSSTATLEHGPTFLPSYNNHVAVTTPLVRADL